MPNKIQPREHSKGGDLDGALYITDSNGNPNIFVLKRNDNGLWLNANYYNLDNFFNADNCFLFRLRHSLHFFSDLNRRSFF